MNPDSFRGLGEPIDLTQRPAPQSTRDELIKKYADEIKNIIGRGTVGDYTWEGVLVTFMMEVDKTRG